MSLKSILLERFNSLKNDVGESGNRGDHYEHNVYKEKKGSQTLFQFPYSTSSGPRIVTNTNSTDKLTINERFDNDEDVLHLRLKNGSRFPELHKNNVDNSTESVNKTENDDERQFYRNRITDPELFRSRQECSLDGIAINESTMSSMDSEELPNDILDIFADLKNGSSDRIRDLFKTTSSTESSAHYDTDDLSNYNRLSSGERDNQESIEASKLNNLSDTEYQCSTQKTNPLPPNSTQENIYNLNHHTGHDSFHDLLIEPDINFKPDRKIFSHEERNLKENMKFNREQNTEVQKNEISFYDNTKVKDSEKCRTVDNYRYNFSHGIKQKIESLERKEPDIFTRLGSRNNLNLPLTNEQEAPNQSAKKYTGEFKSGLEKMKSTRNHDYVDSSTVENISANTYRERVALYKNNHGKLNIDGGVAKQVVDSNILGFSGLQLHSVSSPSYKVDSVSYSEEGGILPGTKNLVNYKDDADVEYYSKNEIFRSNENNHSVLSTLQKEDSGGEVQFRKESESTRVHEKSKIDTGINQDESSKFLDTGNPLIAQTKISVSENKNQALFQSLDDTMVEDLFKKGIPSTRYIARFQNCITERKGGKVVGLWVKSFKDVKKIVCDFKLTKEEEAIYYYPLLENIQKWILPNKRKWLSTFSRLSLQLAKSERKLCDFYHQLQFSLYLCIYESNNINQVGILMSSVTRNIPWMYTEHMSLVKLFFQQRGRERSNTSEYTNRLERCAQVYDSGIQQIRNLIEMCAKWSSVIYSKLNRLEREKSEKIISQFESCHLNVDIYNRNNTDFVMHKVKIQYIPEIFQITTNLFLPHSIRSHHNFAIALVEIIFEKAKTECKSAEIQNNVQAKLDRFLRFLSEFLKDAPIKDIFLDSLNIQFMSEESRKCIFTITDALDGVKFNEKYQHDSSVYRTVIKNYHSALLKKLLFTHSYHVEVWKLRTYRFLNNEITEIQLNSKFTDVEDRMLGYLYQKSYNIYSNQV